MYAMQQVALDVAHRAAPYTTAANAVHAAAVCDSTRPELVVGVLLGAVFDRLAACTHRSWPRSPSRATASTKPAQGRPARAAHLLPRRLLGFQGQEVVRCRRTQSAANQPMLDLIATLFVTDDGDNEDEQATQCAATAAPIHADFLFQFSNECEATSS